jgi:hypothetical protein
VNQQPIIKIGTVIQDGITVSKITKEGIVLSDGSFIDKKTVEESLQ